MQTFTLTIAFTDEDKGYIANPYWPEINTLINVQKESGMNRAKSDANRRKALEEWLRANKKTLSWYEKLQKDAARPFYTSADGEIVIPKNQLIAFLVATCDTARAAQRPCSPDQVHARFRVSDFATGKVEADGVWERFATVTAGTGAKLSNQRGFRSSPYIRDFSATGTISFDEQYVNSDTLKNAISWGGQFVGLGASRKMGWGRFDVTRFAQNVMLKAA